MQLASAMLYLNGKELRWNRKTLLTLPPVAALVALFHFSCSRRVGADLYFTLLIPVSWPSFQLKLNEMNHVEKQYKVLCTLFAPKNNPIDKEYNNTEDMLQVINPQWYNNQVKTKREDKSLTLISASTCLCTLWFKGAASSLLKSISKLQFIIKITS